jgi:protein TonB
MTAAQTDSWNIFPSASNRLLVGLAISVSMHVAIVLAVRPVTYAYVPPQPLHVEIRDVTPAPTVDGASSVAAAQSDYSALLSAPAKASEPSRTEARETAPDPHSGADLGLATDRYYLSSEVDVRAEPIGETNLVYPQSAYQQRLPGKVTVSILISQRGSVDEVAVVKADPPGIFEQAALSAARELKFSPALRGGRAVKSKKLVEVEFDPYERISHP